MKINIRILVTTALAAMVATGMYAQNTFFPTKAGMIQVYENKNTKGNTESFVRQTIKNVEGSGNNMTISYVAESLDKNRKPLLAEIPYTVTVKDGVVILDMNQFFAGMLQQDQPLVEITGVPMELPGDMQPGQSLKDAEMTMTLNLGIMKMKTVMKMTDGKCLAIEAVTVPAGTFESHKITQTVSTTALKKTTKTRTVSWYAPGIGTVKSETYDDKDKLMSSIELVEIN
jgi:hypothetical protein